MDIKFGFESIHQKDQKCFDSVLMKIWVEKDKHERSKI